MRNLQPTKADIEIAKCIDEETSFAVIAGAGSGKTTSLIEALKKIRKIQGPQLRASGQKSGLYYLYQPSGRRNFITFGVR